MSDEMRDRVREGYEEIDLTDRQAHDADIPDAERPLIDAFLDAVPDGGHVVDMGCGTGVPYDRELVDRGYEVIGVDIAPSNVAAARERVPEGTFVEADFSSFSPGETFAGLLCLYALFHVPREEHRDVLSRFHDLLEHGAPMLITVGTADVDEMEHEFLGGEMVWSFFDAERNRELIRDAGFTIERAERLPDPIDDGEHLWVLATA